MDRRRVVAAAIFAVTGLPAGEARAQTDYALSADSEPQPGVPSGRVVKRAWASAIFPGTQRDFWIYVPAQYRPESAAAVMVFQDGGRFVDGGGRWRVPVVFDNLIHKGEMPVTIGIFIDPGLLGAGTADQQPRFNRSFEYDALGDRYARFLTEEVLPEVAREYALTSDPNLRAIGGSSSGGVCAFTVAWNRPDAFRRVLSFIGSYTGLRGGDAYPTLVRKTEPKPIRVFLQDGSRDLDIYSGNWWIGNQAMASALEYAGYDVRFVAGDRGHDNVQGSAVLPDALRWLWRHWSEPIAASRGKPGAERHYVTEILDPAADWQPVGEGHGAITALAADRGGEVYFSEPDVERIGKVEDATGKFTVFRHRAGKVSGIAFGPDGRLYASQGDRRRIVAFAADASEEVVAEGIPASGLAVDARGGIWCSDHGNRRLWHVDPSGNARVAHEGLPVPSGLSLTPDQALLVAADSGGRWVWSFQVAADGSLRHGQPFYRLDAPDESSDAAAGGMTADSEGFLYVATRLGIQVFDQPGRLNATLAAPPAAVASSLVFGGKDRDVLYAAAGGRIFRRHLRRKGVPPGPPVKLPTPRL